MTIHQTSEVAAMQRTIVVTGVASGIGAATAKRLRDDGERVIGADLHDADVVADLASAEGRAALAEGVARLPGGKSGAIVANAGGGPPETCLQLNFFGAVATLEALRPLLSEGAAPRAVAVSSIASLRPPPANLVETLLANDEAGARALARRQYEMGELGEGREAGLALYGAAKLALNRWCRRAAASPAWAGAGIPLNVVALGFYDTPAAAPVLNDREARGAMAAMAPLKGAFPGRADEAAAMIAFLVSPENSQMTGQVLYADAGVECRLRGATL